MKQLLSLLLVLSLAACAAGPRTDHTGQSALATEEALSTTPREQAVPGEDLSRNAEHDPDNQPVLETEPVLKPASGSPADTCPEASEPQTPPEEEPAPERLIDPTRPMVALTFDDGPHPAFTDQILDILEENHAVATFFEVAANLHKAPDAVRRAADMGCEIGSHSYRHANLGKMSLEAIQADLAAADEAFVQVLGQAPTLLRPPYGSMNEALKTGSGRTLVTWSIDPQDWLTKNTDKVVSSVQGSGDLDGQVILLHSIYGTTVEATRVLVPWLLEQGYQLVTVSELLTLRYRQEIQANHLYGYSFFGNVPPLAEAPASDGTAETLSAKPAADTPVKVKLVLREAVSGETARTEPLGQVLYRLRTQAA